MTTDDTNTDETHSTGRDITQTVGGVNVAETPDEDPRPHAVPDADPENSDDELLDEYRKRREDTHAVDVEYLLALETYVFELLDRNGPADALRCEAESIAHHGPVLLEADDD